MTWQEENELQENVLDDYDFIPYLEKYDNIEDLMEAMETDCDSTSLPEEMNGLLFNFYGPDGVAIYLTNRYLDWIFPEIITYGIYKRRQL